MSDSMHRRRRYRQSAPPIVPVTQNFSYSAVAGGWTLLGDPSSVSGRHYVLASSSQSLAATWVGVITGQAAYVKMTSDYLPGRETMIRVSVDGGAYANAAYDAVSGEYTLFSGAAEGAHFVTFQVNGSSIEAPFAYMGTTGDVLRIFGVAPAMAPAGEWTTLGDANSKTIKPNGLIPSDPGGSYAGYGASKLPAFQAAQDIGAYSGVGRTGMQALIALRTAASELWVVSQYRWVYVWDGTTLSEHDTVTPLGIGADNIRVLRISGLTGLKTYHVYGGALISGPAGAWFSVGVPAGMSFVPLANTFKAHCFGDSITQGTGANADQDQQTSGRVDLFRSFAKLGYAVGNFGLGGQTAFGLDSALDNYLARLTVTANDVAFVAIGQNGSPTAGEVTNIASKLVGKGYRRVVFRGVLPIAGNSHTAKNTTISAAVSAFANGAVKYIDTNGWTELATNSALKWDGVHPNPAGYSYMEAQMDSALPSALA
jgi:lysophospholipase L1-like esterase